MRPMFPTTHLFFKKKISKRRNTVSTSGSTMIMLKKGAYSIQSIYIKKRRPHIGNTHLTGVSVRVVVEVVQDKTHQT